MPGAAAKRNPDLDALAEDLKDRGRAATVAGIAALERRIGSPLPPAYRAFLGRVNGGSVTGEWEFQGKYMLQELYGVRRDREYSLVRRLDQARGYPIPEETIPIASDVGGNLICLAVSGSRTGSVWYWDHEEGGERLSDLSRIAPSFAAFLRGLKRTGPEKNEELERILDRDDAAGMERYLKDLPRKQWNRNLPSGSTLLEEAAARGAVRVMKVLIAKKIAGRHASRGGNLAQSAGSAEDAAAKRVQGGRILAAGVRLQR